MYIHRYNKLKFRGFIVIPGITSVEKIQNLPFSDLFYYQSNQLRIPSHKRCCL